MKKTLSLFITLVVLTASGVWADPLPGYNDLTISVANNSNTFYMGFPSATQGLNAEWVGPVGATIKTGLTSVSTADPFFAGSFACYDTGGSGGGVTDFILLASIQGVIAGSFSLNLTWSAYNETFTLSDFIYGPQTTKPSGVATMALYPGQDITDPSTAAYLMFVDLQAGGIGLGSAVPVSYSFTGLYGNVVAFNMYGYSPTGGNVLPGTPSINWTNDTATNGYVVFSTAETPVPVPPAILLMASGLGGLALIRRKWGKRQ